MPTIYVERQPDGQYLAYDDDGPIVRAPTQTAAASLAKVANPVARVLVGRRGKWRRWQCGHVGSARRARKVSETTVT